MAKGCEIHVLSNTHWDREWVHSYQRVRIMLVEMMDQLLDILDKDPNYKYYHLDSQTIPLEDYLEIRPENRERLKKHIQHGRLLIGPWYILPDEFLVSGESLVRNLLRGHKVAQQFGSVMKVGYTPFSWGQISQLPQIYSGFGIDTVLFYRGINRVVAPESEFIWEGADGTRALSSRFTVWPRYNFWYLIYRPVAFGLFPTDRAYDWKRHDLPCRMCDEFSCQESYNLLISSQNPHWELLRDCVQQTKEDHLKDTNTNVLLWMQGHDSSAPIPLVPEIIEETDELFPEDKIIHSSFPAYIKRLKEELKEKELKVLKGEMRYVNVDGKAVLDLPGEIEAESLAVLDADGKEVDIQIDSKERTVALVEQLVDVPLSVWEGDGWNGKTSPIHRCKAGTNSSTRFIPTADGGRIPMSSHRLTDSTCPCAWPSAGNTRECCRRS